MPFFYIPEFHADTRQISIEGDEYHHIVHVFRHRENDTIQFTNGNGILGEATIHSITKKQLTLEIPTYREFQQSTPPISVAFSLLRNKNDEWLVEKLTELGVKTLYPMVTANSVRQPSHNPIEKFKKTAISAIKQCENPWLPVIEEVRDLKDVLQVLKSRNIRPLVASEKDKNVFLPDVLPDKTEPVCLLIGPEGGFSSDEFALFEENHVAVYSLGNNILRAETAAISAVSQLLLQYLEQQPNYI
ncbi:MAG TPA: RsmE family RNA methyltransferase [Candidatus Cloacimonadota bacterium]|nr:RsmE family RNA methyltransferase [Candidatus Cloacimonadota bacterium]HPT72713.1 RsmE family RNA methyltransferase [Candidatus Cloacimonadota bacterium]